MRLWHKDLIPYLPRKQLIAQWRECCAIASNIANKGTPNHILVNKIMDYDIKQFFNYCVIVIQEIKGRGYKINKNTYKAFLQKIKSICWDLPSDCNIDKIFEEWHNERYLKQCLFNLQEKYDCDGITEEEWLVISNQFGKYLYTL